MNSMKLIARTDRELVRAGARSDRYVHLTLTAPAGHRTRTRAPVHVTLVLDRSGSMGGEKIRLAKEAVHHSLHLLDERDRFSLVFYDDKIDVVVESTPATGEAVRNALERIVEVQARGSTNLAEGWLKGVEQIALHQDPEFVNRALLLTDGLANVGITNGAELERHAAEIRRRGISTTTFGVGADFDEDLLRRMAQAGGGNFYFIETPGQIPDLLTSELGETLETVARAVRIVVETSAGIVVKPMTPVAEELHEGTRWVLGIGDLVSRQEVECLIRLNFPRGEEGTAAWVRLSVEDRDGAELASAPALRWTFADHRANDVQARDRAVDRVVARTYASLARREALILNRDGRYEEARARLHAVARRIRDYAGDDPELNRIWQELEDEAPELFTALGVMERKSRYYMANLDLTSRTPEGKARRARD